MRWYYRSDYQLLTDLSLDRLGSILTNLCVVKYNRTGTQGTPALTPPLPVPRSELRLQKSEVTKKKLVESPTGWDKFGQMMRELRNDQSCPSPPPPTIRDKAQPTSSQGPRFFFPFKTFWIIQKMESDLHGGFVSKKRSVKIQRKIKGLNFRLELKDNLLPISCESKVELTL